MVAIVLSSGQRGAIVRLTGERVWLQSPIAAAPGARVEAQLDSGLAVSVKAQRCVKRSDGGFDVQGRIVNMTRELRNILTASLSADHESVS